MHHITDKPELAQLRKELENEAIDDAYQARVESFLDDNDAMTAAVAHDIAYRDAYIDGETPEKEMARGYAAMMVRLYRIDTIIAKIASGVPMDEITRKHNMQEFRVFLREVDQAREQIERVIENEFTEEE